jgi:hypothetical protein
MTYEQIKKALERCGQHRECCYCNYVEECGNKRVLTASVLALINRKDAEIERLRGDLEYYQKGCHNLCKELDAEKIKNF